MMLKTENCRLCGATFVPFSEKQKYCNKCMINFESVEDKIIKKKFKKCVRK